MVKCESFPVGTLMNYSDQGNNNNNLKTAVSGF